MRFLAYLHIMGALIFVGVFALYSVPDHLLPTGWVLHRNEIRSTLTGKVISVLEPGMKLEEERIIQKRDQIKADQEKKIRDLERETQDLQNRLKALRDKQAGPSAAEAK